VWRQLSATQALVRPSARFLLLRVLLERRLDAAPGASPSVSQVEARTAADTLLDRLPATYARSAGDGILGDLLAFAQAQLDDLEERVAGLPARFTASTGEIDELQSLAAWQAFALPDDALADDAAAARGLISELPELYAARGTPDGIARYVEALTGARPHLFELFRERALWMLGGDAGLGIGTRLAPATLGGLVVGSSAIGEAVPDDDDPPGAALFEESAHRFVALIPPGAAPTADAQARVRRALEEERPAHTDYHVCFAGPDARVGIQARVGVDAVVAGPTVGAPLDERALLGVTARLADTPER
jgi:phage tail-like protein